MSFGARSALRIYSEILGFVVCFSAFIWVMFQVYAIFQTPEHQHELRMARYLDICFGCLAFFSSLALMYGAFVESKTWISAWTLGSLTVVIGMWAWYFHKRYSETPHPEVTRDFETAGIVLTAIYCAACLPVWLFQHQIEYWDLRSMCTWEWICPSFVLSIRRNTNSGRTSTHHQCHQYLPSYAQCTTNTFLAPTHTQVNRIPASKDEDLYNPV